MRKGPTPAPEATRPQTSRGAAQTAAGAHELHLSPLQSASSQRGRPFQYLAPQTQVPLPFASGHSPASAHAGPCGSEPARPGRRPRSGGLARGPTPRAGRH